MMLAIKGLRDVERLTIEAFGFGVVAASIPPVNQQLRPTVAISKVVGHPITAAIFVI
jgi:hypothetical protein